MRTKVDAAMMVLSRLWKLSNQANRQSTHGVNLRYYKPAIFLFLLGLVAFLFPKLVSYFMGSIFLFLAALYGFSVFNFRAALRKAGKGQVHGAFQQDVNQRSGQEPNFHNVSYTYVKKFYRID